MVIFWLPVPSIKKQTTKIYINQKKYKVRRGKTMKFWKKLGRRILAGCLSVSLLLTSFPMTAMANESPGKISVEVLEGIAEPTEFPAEGTIHLYVMKEVPMDAYNEDCFAESYLPVIVDENKHVYAQLSSIAQRLGMRIEASTGPQGEQVRVVRYHNSALFLKERTTEATYVKYINNGRDNVESIFPYTHFIIENVPLMYKDEFYVPIDSFLQCTDSPAFYSGVNEDGKQDLYIIPPQRTVLDDMIYVCNEDYSYYAFDFIKDLGMSDRDVTEQYYSSEAVQYIQRLGTIFDAGAWSLSLGADDRFFDDEYIDMYMDHALHAFNEVLDAGWDYAKNTVDAASIVCDAIEWNINPTWKQTTLITAKQLSKVNKVSSISGMAGDSSFVVGNVLSYWSILASLYGADAISFKGAELLAFKYNNLTSNKFLDNNNRERVKKNINDYHSSKKNIVIT